MPADNAAADAMRQAHLKADEIYSRPVLKSEQDNTNVLLPPIDGDAVTIQGMEAAAYNGLEGVILGDFDGTNGRFCVQLPNMIRGSKKVKVKPQNVVAKVERRGTKPGNATPRRFWQEFELMKQADAASAVRAAAKAALKAKADAAVRVADKAVAAAPQVGDLSANVTPSEAEVED